MAEERSKREDRRRQWAQLRRILRPHRGRVAFMSFSSFLAGVTEAALLVVVTRVALAIADGDERFGVFAGRTMSINAAIAVAAALVAVRLALALLSMRLAVSLTTRVGTSARRNIADAYLRASWATQQSESSGRLQELLISYAGSVQGSASSFAVGLNAGLSLTALVLGSILINPVATLVVLGSLVVLGALLAPLRQRIRVQARRAADAQMQFATSISELGELGVEMQAFGVRDQFARRIDGLISAHANWQAKAGIAHGVLTPMYTAFAFTALVAGLALASALDAGELGGAAAVMLVMLRALSYGQALQSASGSLAGLAPYLETIDDIVIEYRANPAEVGSIDIDQVGAITAEGVSFEYLEGRQVLDDVSFAIEAGEVIGIVGPSGGGKSTLVQLLLGLRNPGVGRISVGGHDLRDVTRHSWSARAAYVAQDARLLTGSIAENIAFFRSGIGIERIREAARDANVATDVEAMPDGFETIVGGRGGNLSGGQRQRVSIARALAGDPQLLVLDEPTSALDVRSEQLIRETIAALKGRVTVVIIAHRLSTLDACDRIMVIEEGQLRAVGTPKELSLHNEFFRHSLELSGMRP